MHTKKNTHADGHTQTHNHTKAYTFTDMIPDHIQSEISQRCYFLWNMAPLPLCTFLQSQFLFVLPYEWNRNDGPISEHRIPFPNKKKIDSIALWFPETSAVNKDCFQMTGREISVGVTLGASACYYSTALPRVKNSLFFPFLCHTLFFAWVQSLQWGSFSKITVVDELYVQCTAAGLPLCEASKDEQFEVELRLCIPGKYNHNEINYTHGWDIKLYLDQTTRTQVFWNKAQDEHPYLLATQVQSNQLTTLVCFHPLCRCPHGDMMNAARLPVSE